MKYQNELAKINKTEDKMPAGLKQYVKSINELLETKSEITRRIAAKEGNPEELQSDLAECEGDINNLDAELSQKVINWGVQIERLANARASKKPLEPKQPAAKKAAPVKNAPVAAPVAAPPEPAPMNADTPASQEPVKITVSTTDNTIKVTSEPEKKKGSGASWVFFGVLALVVTVGAVNLLKKD